MSEKKFEFQDGAGDIVKVEETFANTCLSLLFIDAEGDTEPHEMMFTKDNIKDFERILAMLKELK